MNKETQSEYQEAEEAHPPTKAGRPILHLPRKAHVTTDLHQSAANGVESENPGDRPLAASVRGCVQPAVDKFASCEFSRASDDTPESPSAAGTSGLGGDIANADSGSVSASPLTEQEQLLAPKSDLELAIERCTDLGDRSDPMVVEKWGKRGAPILEQSLRFLAAYKAAGDEERKGVRKALKLKSGVRREPNADNLSLIAVYLCVSCSGKPQTNKQRKQWCRFATVVKVAAAASISPDEAAKWLEKKTLNVILADWQAKKKADGAHNRKPAVPKALKAYKHLIAALVDGSEFHALAMAELAKADAAIASAVADAAALPATLGTLPVEAVAADA